jgi:hypothetical protein
MRCEPEPLGITKSLATPKRKRPRLHLESRDARLNSPPPSLLIAALNALTRIDVLTPRNYGARPSRSSVKLGESVCEARAKSDVNSSWKWHLHSWCPLIQL